MKDKDIRELLNLYEEITKHETSKEVLYIGLFGSQNYNLSTNNSDVDVIAVLELSLNEYILGTRINRTIKTHSGNISVIDVVSFMQQLQKGTPNHVEVSNTEFWIGSAVFRQIIEGTKVKPHALKGMFISYFKKIKEEISLQDKKFNINSLLKSYCHCIRIHRHSLNLDLPFYTFDENDEIPELRNTLKMSLSFIEDALRLENLLKEFDKTIESSNFVENNIQEEVLNFVKCNILLEKGQIKLYK